MLACPAPHVARCDLPPPPAPPPPYAFLGIFDVDNPFWELRKVVVLESELKSLKASLKITKQKQRTETCVQTIGWGLTGKVLF